MKSKAPTKSALLVIALRRALSNERDPAVRAWIRALLDGTKVKRDGGRT